MSRVGGGLNVKGYLLMTPRTSGLGSESAAWDQTNRTFNGRKNSATATLEIKDKNCGICFAHLPNSGDMHEGGFPGGSFNALQVQII